MGDQLFCFLFNLAIHYCKWLGDPVKPTEIAQLSMTVLCLCIFFLWKINNLQGQLTKKKEGTNV